MFWKTLGRVIIVIPFAFLVSALTAILILLTLALEQMTQMLHGAGDDPEAMAVMLYVFMRLATLMPFLTLVPALLVVIVGEVARIRSALYYIVGGGAALTAIPLLARLGPSIETTPTPDVILWSTLATAGFAGGLIYWLIAGRNA